MTDDPGLALPTGRVLSYGYVSLRADLHSDLAVFKQWLRAGPSSKLLP